MKCPFCGELETKVIDTRLSKEGDLIRRRRECLRCSKRFTTFERFELSMPLVIKKDGRREAFSREKIFRGIQKACEKRPVSTDDIDAIVRKIETALAQRGEKEVPSSVIGEMVIKELYNLDKVAYVRFASVYKEFKDVEQFMDELKKLLRKKRK
jgi:transcriptional repressor NrdR